MPGSARLTRRRLLVLAALLAIAIAAILLGDPIAHAEAGASADGTRGLEGVPRIAELVGLAIAFVLALPPSGSDA